MKDAGGPEQFRNDCHWYRYGFRTKEPVAVARSRITGAEITDLLKRCSSNDKRTEDPASVNVSKEFLSKPGR